MKFVKKDKYDRWPDRPVVEKNQYYIRNGCQKLFADIGNGSFTVNA